MKKDREMATKMLKDLFSFEESASSNKKKFKYPRYKENIPYYNCWRNNLNLLEKRLIELKNLGADFESLSATTLVNINQIDLIELLIKYGLNVNKKSKVNTYPIERCIYLYKKLALYLIDKDYFDLSVKLIGDKNVLMVALENENYKIVKKLLEKDLSLIKGTATKNIYQCLDLMIDKGGSCNQKNLILVEVINKLYYNKIKFPREGIKNKQIYLVHNKIRSSDNRIKLRNELINDKKEKVFKI